MDKKAFTHLVKALRKNQSLAKLTQPPSKFLLTGLRYARPSAFTLAEVLITLSILGVVAAISAPNLISSHQKHIVEKKVVKFYSLMQDVFAMSTAENGPVYNWDWQGYYNSKSYNGSLNFNKKYILPYLKYKSVKPCYTQDVGFQQVCVTLPDNSMFVISIKAEGHILYYINGKQENNTRNFFAFSANRHDNNVIYSVTPFVGSIYNWDRTYNQLVEKCRNGGYFGQFNTKLLEMNNWKITKDYPW